MQPAVSSHTRHAFSPLFYLIHSHTIKSTKEVCFQHYHVQWRSVSSRLEDFTSTLPLLLTLTSVLSLVTLRHERRLHKQSWISLEDFFVLRSFRAPIGRNKRAKLSVPRRPIFPRNNSTGTISGTTQQEPNNSAISYFFKDIKNFVISYQHIFKGILWWTEVGTSVRIQIFRHS